jgi:hypothetical protein
LLLSHGSWGIFVTQINVDWTQKLPGDIFTEQVGGAAVCFVLILWWWERVE